VADAGVQVLEPLVRPAHCSEPLRVSLRREFADQFQVPSADRLIVGIGLDVEDRIGINHRVSSAGFP
jgi:hypothetical protein